ncbi:MAG: hypothetical protein ABIR57_03525 [Aeromicrobium sp.]
MSSQTPTAPSKLMKAVGDEENFVFTSCARRVALIMVASISDPVPDARVVSDFSLFTLACVLTGDSARAWKLVVETFGSGRMSFAGDKPVVARDVVREFARRIYLASGAGNDAGGSPSSSPSGNPAGTFPGGGLRTLPNDQRDVLALCAYGGHTDDEAAALLNLPAPRVNELLQSALRGLDPAF